MTGDGFQTASTERTRKKMAPQPSVPMPLPWTFFSHCSFSKDINEHDDKSRTHHSHFLFFCYLSISNESIHLPRAKGMRGENESHLWCPIVQRWLLWTSLSPASQLPSWQKIPLVSDKRQFAFISCSVERQFQCTQFTKKKHLCYHTNGNGWEQNVLECSTVIGRHLGSLSAWYIHLTVGAKGPESELQHLSPVRTDRMYLAFISFQLRDTAAHSFRNRLDIVLSWIMTV